MDDHDLLLVLENKLQLIITHQPTNKASLSRASTSSPFSPSKEGETPDRCQGKVNNSSKKIIWT
jgi:hypothetical protein